MWNLVPDKLKQLVEIQAFKKEIKKGKPKTAHIGYVKLVYHMLILFKFLSLYLHLKHIQQQSTKNSLMEEFFDGRTLVHLLRTS